jgi:hypothetical protein
MHCCHGLSQGHIDRRIRLLTKSQNDTGQAEHDKAYAGEHIPNSNHFWIGFSERLKKPAAKKSFGRKSQHQARAAPISVYARRLVLEGNAVFDIARTFNVHAATIYRLADADSSDFQIAIHPFLYRVVVLLFLHTFYFHVITGTITD